MDFTIVMFSWIVAIAIAIIILCFMASKMCEVASLKGYEPAKNIFLQYASGLEYSAIFMS